MAPSNFPTCITCTEEYPFMDTITHPICGSCLYNDKLETASDPDSIPPLKFCKDGCGIQLGRYATDMCGPCKQKSGQLTQQPPPRCDAPLPAKQLSPASIASIRKTIDLPSRPAASTSRLQTPAQVLGNCCNCVVPSPAPVSRPIKRSAPDPSELTPTMLNHAEGYKQGETRAKRVRMDCIEWEDEMARSATRHFQENSVGFFQNPTKSCKSEKLLYPNLPSYDSTFYLLGVSTAKLSGDPLKEHILLLSTKQPGKRKAQGPVVMTLFFAAATYLASTIPTSFQLNSNSGNEQSKKDDQSNQSDEDEESEELDDFLTSLNRFQPILRWYLRLSQVF
ncbi:uncharacterized protein MELLADRAFT_113123 [Melampsora larici-populina 98AG31]|uniref:Uncharacterized protein n=1 Tax=Melampsora larici-populina (strain 98AG31 / pathotype 3-4-7) TaxID=747676 RepID=F4S8U0_MELLP|nr:uncharacterized protein MELLADRAFT_113123 [Melampsora larici-populina 98AG31]EGF98964.1 hypothetical protein MELLADRAFT_113123 [Melampsora larici-populina 98AG31]